MQSLPKMLIYGAGNIGRGFLADLGHQSGYACVFVDIRNDIIDALNAQGAYNHISVSSEEQKHTTIHNVSGVHAKDTPAVIEEIVHADLITTAVGKDALAHLVPTLQAGLLERIKQGNRNALMITLIAFENIHGNTTYLKSLLLKDLSSEQQKSILDHVQFPNSLVDRIVPNYVGQDMLDVCVEDYYQIALDAKAMHHPIGLSGIEVTHDLDALADQKLFTLNMGHALTAYLGKLAGKETIHEAITHTGVEHMIASTMQEISLLLSAKYPTITYDTHQDYVRTTLKRFKNPHLQDQVDRVARDPIRKLGPDDRLIYPYKELAKQGIMPTFLGSGIAGALHYTNHNDPQALLLSQEIATRGLNSVIDHRLGIGMQTEQDQALRNIITSHYLLRSL